MKNLEDIKRLRVVVDMVNGFIREGALADKDIEKIIPGIVDWIEKETKGEDEALALVKDVHEADAAEFKAFPPHCIKGTRESELVDELKPYEKDALVYEKNSTSVMFAPGFIDDIKAMTNLKEVELTGCCTDICILNAAIPLVNYFNQNNREVAVNVRTDLVDTFNAPGHSRDEWTAMSLKLMKQAGVNLRREY